MHFAAIMGVATAMGGATRPTPRSAVSARIGRVTVSEVIAPAMPLIAVGYLPGLMLTAFWPGLSPFVPRRFGDR